ncbi:MULTISPECIES: TolC family protein [Fibrobacter]|uniref:TolC family protein n=1 Tax=Fibrobacter TaxID=832 RepID=UPI000B526818|nr:MULTISPECIES: TolC family protein [Fibrobacter]MBO4830133.1 TolC family protein [Fibrobacter sp.]OWV19604.1 transporter [Fibrobacter sp. UWB4]
MIRNVFFILALAGVALAGDVRYDCLRFVEQGLAKDPQVAETKFGLESKTDKMRSLKAEAILPTLNVSMMVGPAPGLKETVDNWGDTVDTYDFSRMGPFWAVQAKFIQPLNLGQYQTGKKALEADLQQKTFEIENKVLKKEVELQTYYYNYLLALEMKRVAGDAQKQVDKAYDQLEEALDEDEPTVSQTDLLNLKAKMHTVKEGVIEADLGMKRVMLMIRFVLGLSEEDPFVTEDSVLAMRKEPLPTEEQVRELTIKHNPELKQLDAGLRARKLQMDLAEARLAPEFFVMGEFEYVKSWAGNRNVLQKSAFAQDAVNKISGLIGIGLRYRLNFWKTWEEFRQARTDYRGLRLKESYATDGLVSKAIEQYYQVVAAKGKLDALRESLRATEALLKDAAMKYDLDKSQTGALVSAYTQNITMQKDYYFAVCRYNVEFAGLVAKMGLSIREYNSYFNK